MARLTTETSADHLITDDGFELITSENAIVAFDVATGITIADLTVIDDTEIELEIDITGGAPATARDVTVTTSEGTSNALPFTVTAAVGGGLLPHRRHR